MSGVVRWVQNWTRDRSVQVVALAVAASVVGAIGLVKVVDMAFQPSGGSPTAAGVGVISEESPPHSTSLAPTTVVPTTVVSPAPALVERGSGSWTPSAPVPISPRIVPPSTDLAAPNGTIPVFAGPAAQQIGTVGTWYSYRLVLPVIDESVPDWLQVRLPLRPNGSIGWVRTSDVTMSSTPYRIIIDLSARHLIVYENANPVMSFPVGIGVPNTPTPTGAFFVAVHEVNPPPGYGPFVLDTSAHSEAIQSWEGAGDAVVAIHGPISSYSDSAIGSSGTRISNGCIRMHNGDLAQLAMIPVGAPVDIYG